MSKSDENQKSSIYLLDNINTAKNKIRSAVTDSDRTIKYDLEKKPGISNLLEIFSSLTNKSIDELVKEYANSTYKDFKEDLANEVGNLLEDIQEKYKKLYNSQELTDILNEGAKKAELIASRKMSRVYHRLGLLRK